MCTRLVRDKSSAAWFYSPLTRGVGGVDNPIPLLYKREKHQLTGTKTMSTTALYKALLEAHVSEDTAEKAVEGLGYPGEAATKTDIARLEDKLEEKASKTDLAELEMRMTTKMAELETKLTAQMSALETRILRWNITLAGIIIAAVALIEKL